MLALVLRVVGSVLVAVATWFLARYLFVWINHGLFTVLQPKIELVNADGVPGLVLVRLTVENRSKVYAKIKEGRSRLQILEYHPLQMATPSALSEWVPFYKWRQKKAAMKPIQWRDSVPVMTSTTHIEPGESIRVELLYRASQPGVAIHCGLQVRTVPIMAKLYRNKKGRVRRFSQRCLHNPTTRFTTTAWVLVKSEAGAKNVAA
jgi:hypothetical protein